MSKRVRKRISNTKTYEKRKEMIKEIPSFLWQVIKERFPERSPEGFLLVIGEDIKAKNIPKRTADRLRTQKQRELKKIKREMSYDRPIIPDSEITFEHELKDKNSMTPEEFLKLSENQKIIAECLELINNPSILTDRERQVLSMRYLYEDYEDKQPTFEKIGKELGISKPRAKQIELNALEKLKSHFKPYDP